MVHGCSSWYAHRFVLQLDARGLDQTFLKKLLYPERFADDELPPDLAAWLRDDARVAAIASMLPPADLSFKKWEDQALNYMARRFRGNIKGPSMQCDVECAVRWMDRFDGRAGEACGA